MLDRIRDVADDTPVVRSRQGWVDKDVVFGIDTSLARGLSCRAGIPDEHDHEHSREVDVLSLRLPQSADEDGGYVDVAALEALLRTAPKDEVYRIKGILRLRVPPPQHPDTAATDDTPVAPPAGNRWVLNWAFGRWRFVPLRESSVVTTIDTETPIKTVEEFSPSSLTVCAETEASLTKRKGSIEVLVQTSIRTVVEEKAPESGECAWMSFVLRRDEGARWKARLEENAPVRYDRPDASTAARIVSLA